MREILFRGKMSNGEWVYGNLHISKTGTSIITPDDTPIGKYGQVDPESVGQYTGLTDRNGTKIFEGDVVTALFWQERPVYATVKFADGGFGLAWDRGNVGEFNPFTSLCNVEYEVVGNIHDNPELLEVADDG